MCPLQDRDKYMFPSHSGFAIETRQDKVNPGHKMTAWEGNGSTHSSIAPAQHWSSLTDASRVKNPSDSSLANWGLLKWKKASGEAERKVSDP